jgi:hypothetical protein
MPGYSSSAIITESGLFLRVNYKYKFINGNTCHDKLTEMSSKCYNGELNRSIRSYFIGRTVMANYGKRLTYKIKEVSDSKNVKNTTIPYRDINGNLENITLFKYYREHYGIDIKYIDDPLFMAENKKDKQGNQETIYLVPELMLLTGMDENMLSDDNLKNTLKQKTQNSLKERMDKTLWEFKKLIYKQNSKKEKVVKRTGEQITLPDPNDIREQWGLKINGCTQIYGRKLDPPEIMFRNKKGDIFKGKIKNSGEILEPVDLNDKNFYIICTNQNKNTCSDVINQLKKVSFKLGIKLDEPKCLNFQGRSKRDWIEFLEDHKQNLKCDNSSNIDPKSSKIALVILDSYSENFYLEIKRYLYCEIGIPSQVIHTKNLRIGLPYFNSILIQVMAKLGTILYSINIDQDLCNKVSIIM